MVEMNPIQAAVWNGEPDALREMTTWLKDRQEEIQINVDLDGPDMKIGKFSLLESAILMNNVEVVRILLDAGVNPCPAIEFARSRNSVTIMLLLEARAADGLISDTRAGIISLLTPDRNTSILLWSIQMILIFRIVLLH